MNTAKMNARNLLAPYLAAILLSGCALNPAAAPTPTQQTQVAHQIANLRQVLLEANGITQVLASTGVLTPSEQTVASGLYASAVAALNQADAENAAGQSIDVINVTLAAVNGYLQQISQLHTTGRARLSKGSKLP